MSTMALYRDFHPRTLPTRGSPPKRKRQGIFKRLSAAIEGWRQRDTEQEAGRFIAEHGGRITDDIERQLAEHFNGRGFPPSAGRPFRGFE
ncbi:MAG: hypothetical protein KGK33_07260 [Hyphomicrobiales bacterium]|nr:hypothetical protein [Hyphomicrobiales bacterium]